MKRKQPRGIRRDKIADLISIRNQIRPRSEVQYHHTMARKSSDKLPPIWFQNYYSLKESLQNITIKNVQIQHVVRQYERNPSVFTMKILQRQIDKNSKAINDADISVMRFKHNHDKTYGGMGFQQETPIARRTKNNIVNYFQQKLAEQIRLLFQNRQNLELITNRANAIQGSTILHKKQESLASFQDKSFDYRHNERQSNRSFLSQSPNKNDLQVNLQQNSIKGNLTDNRNQVMKQVNYKIENLNIILRRMNLTVHQQGDLINRIDQNLSQCQKNMGSANAHLRKRFKRQEGDQDDEEQEAGNGILNGVLSEFNCRNKINKIILGLYVLNIILILVFLIKNLI